MGSVWARLGSNVTVVEFLDRACPSMDVEITKAFTRVLKKQGLKFKFKTKVGFVPCFAGPFDMGALTLPMAYELSMAIGACSPSLWSAF